MKNNISFFLVLNLATIGVFTGFSAGAQIQNEGSTQGMEGLPASAGLTSTATQSETESGTIAEESYADLKVEAKGRGDTQSEAIENRIRMLERLKERIQPMNQIGEEKKEEILRQIEENIERLKNRTDGSKQADRDYELSLEQDNQPGISQGFAIGAILRIEKIAGGLESIAQRLTDPAKRAGISDSNFQIIANNVKSARESAGKAEAIIKSLEPADVKSPDNREKITEARDYLKAAMTDLIEARKAVNSIILELKEKTEN